MSTTPRTVITEGGSTSVTTDEVTYIFPSRSYVEHPLVPQIRLWTFGIILVIVPFIYLWAKPEHYTPLVDVMFSLFLAIVFYQLGGKSKAVEAESRARERWMPQAESVALKLLTLNASVKKLSNRVRNSCEDVACDLPELQAPKMKPIRVKLKSDCENASERLDDVANQLEDAHGDWARFLYANCESGDCGRISAAMHQQRQKLSEQLLAQQPASAPPAAISVEQESQPEFPDVALRPPS